MYIKLSKNTFVRCRGSEGYITNQLMRTDALYDEVGADFLQQISREPKSVEDIVNRLKTIYGDSATIEEIREEFLNFVQNLYQNKYILVGYDKESLDSTDVDFSYSLKNNQEFQNQRKYIAKSEFQSDTRTQLLAASKRVPKLNGIQFELTGRCNERCVHCYLNNAKKDEGIDLDKETVFRTIEQFVAMGGLNVILSGGEMLLHPDICEIISFCRKKDLVISLLSNLIGLTLEHIQCIKAANVANVQVSLYSMDEAIHDAITTVKGSFRRTLWAINKLIESNIPVQLSCPVMKANYKGLGEVIEFGNRIGTKVATDFMIMAQSDFGKENLSNRLSLEEVRTVIETIIQKKPDYVKLIQESSVPTDILKHNPDFYLEMPLCGAGISNCVISSTGDVYPCSGWENQNMGNVKDSSLEEIWNNSEAFKAIRGICEKDFPKCLACDARDYCQRCLVRNSLESGGDHFYLSDYFCETAKINKEVVEDFLSKNGLDNCQ